MCYPALIPIATTLLSVASSVVEYNQQKSLANSEERLARSQYDLERQQQKKQADEQAEAAALERERIAQEAHAAKGVVKSAGLGEVSMRNLVREISAREGRANATIDRNLELVSQQQRAQAQGSALSLSGRLLDVDSQRPSAAVLGLRLGTDVLKLGGGLYDESRDPGEKRNSAANLGSLGTYDRSRIA